VLAPIAGGPALAGPAQAVHRWVAAPRWLAVPRGWRFPSGAPTGGPWRGPVVADLATPPPDSP